ncbi:MAG: NAD-dependent epimerase/dehydratase family protein [Bacteroidetes bacterium]|nr:MAG: NAD-dependent epimerase/dehydratase family protein [Bacteroidota bacterium]
MRQLFRGLGWTPFSREKDPWNFLMPTLYGNFLYAKILPSEPENDNRGSHAAKNRCGGEGRGREGGSRHRNWRERTIFRAKCWAMRVAVTGATGHIGVNVVRALTEQGHEVRALYRSPAKRACLEGLPCETRQADILRPDSLQDAFRGVDAVIHLAALISIEGGKGGRVHRTNVEGVRHVVAACLRQGVSRLVHFSSVHAFKFRPNDPPVLDERCPPADASSMAYDRSKALGEQEVLRGVERGLSAVILNPTAVIGPHDHWVSLTGQFFRELFRGTLPALVRGGYDWVDVRDVARAACSALQNGRPGERYLLSGHWADTRRIAEICREVSGVRPPALTLPLWTAYLGLPFLLPLARLTGRRPLYTYESLRTIQLAHPRCDNGKARRELGFRPRPLPDTIQDIYHWLKETQAV